MCRGIGDCMVRGIDHAVFIQYLIPVVRFIVPHDGQIFLFGFSQRIHIIVESNISLLKIGITTDFDGNADQPHNATGKLVKVIHIHNADVLFCIALDVKGNAYSCYALLFGVFNSSVTVWYTRSSESIMPFPSVS